MALKPVADRILGAFTEWFCSKGGVWQTTFATLAVVGVELGDRRLDPHAFVLMAVLTVYSAITQPALAYSGATSAARMEAIERRLISLEEWTVESIQRIADAMDVALPERTP